ncbi:MAG: TAXI family TRAP transporter solute-binding subunit [Lawsonibacter sp.]|nr:TAXI family TRAP transporter solute-binding subunit [Lawsonibacter sp.]
MKKILSLALTCALTIGLLASCGGSKPSGGTAQTSSASSGSAAPAPTVKPQDLVMGTGSTGGTYFALGGAMANAINNKLTDQKITITAQSTGASVENMNLINAGELDLGIAMNNLSANAQDGTGAFSAPVTNVAAI